MEHGWKGVFVPGRLFGTEGVEEVFARGGDGGEWS
jgi:hypothetical protein